jgi:hypothetical protein
MRRIVYAGGTFITDDAAAAAVCDFAAALANVGRAAALEVPIIDEHGDRSEVEIVVGPASQVLSEKVDGDDGRLDSAAFVQKVHRDIEQLTWRPTAEAHLGDWDF